MGQKKDPIALKEYVFSHLLVAEKCITRLFKTHHFSFSTGWAIYETPQACHSLKNYSAILPFCLIRDGAREEASWLNVRFAPENLVTPWQKRAVSNGPRPPLLLFCAHV